MDPQERQTIDHRLKKIVFHTYQEGLEKGSGHARTVQLPYTWNVEEEHLWTNATRQEFWESFKINKLIVKL